MKDYRLKIVAVTGCMIGFFLILGWAGSVEYTEQVILHMSQEQYDEVRSILSREGNGQEPSDSDIARWWSEHNKE